LAVANLLSAKARLAEVIKEMAKPRWPCRQESRVLGWIEALVVENDIEECTVNLQVVSAVIVDEA
jgi:hypothetical protein